MINIISRSYCSRLVSGPKKVVDNLIKGLRKIGYPYVVNKRLDACRRLWIHDDTVALAKIADLDPRIKAVVGPNLYVLPRQVPPSLDLSRSIYLQPSEWAKDFWLDFGFASCPIDVWPTGVDTEDFRPLGGQKSLVLIYFKQRSREELSLVEQVLQRKRIYYKVLTYPNYREKNYRKLLSQSRYVVWLGRQESQGLALLEALATNVPILVCDVSYFGQWQASKKQMAVFNQKEIFYPNTTSAPYFDNSCGLKIKDLTKLGEAIDSLEAGLPNFHPRNYVEQHLGLEHQAREFLQIYQRHFGLTEEDGKKETLLAEGDWLNNSLSSRVRFLFKDFLKFSFYKLLK